MGACWVELQVGCIGLRQLLECGAGLVLGHEGDSRDCNHVVHEEDEARAHVDLAREAHLIRVRAIGLGLELGLGLGLGLGLRLAARLSISRERRTDTFSPTKDEKHVCHRVIARGSSRGLGLR